MTWWTAHLSRMADHLAAIAKTGPQGAAFVETKLAYFNQWPKSHARLRGMVEQEMDKGKSDERHGRDG